ncbi:hypothetical protein PPERSA_11522 [Pseudocohnilembus persalinus]|uniref:Sperm-tail PG-rich repeat protein n=1 Tax=Pseudocohnilembus persalinus TaxID=266149 RepID=A0A0V0QXQ7_PSEPJ|nr:hypothetical protein PPERSA_11522 [Pseudocohnilembus persalinus]|eukprot:KRX06877.1 hypothetical protein PPERSA_11522 [Pseudocohnilembus persalinus]
MSIYGNQWQSVFRSPLNNSKSKQQYSFPKSERFKDPIRSYCAKPYYELPTVRDKRQTSLGYGKKFDFTQSQKNTPGANQYNLKGIFEENKLKNKGKTVGVGREKMAHGGIVTHNSKFIPGPGNYTISDTKSHISYSMRSKNENNSIFNFKNKVGIPGPGQYTYVNGDLNKTGKQFNSKYSSSKAYLINPAKSVQSLNLRAKSDTPGPGQYKETVLKKDGKYTQSRYHNIKYGSFSSSKRNFFGIGNTAPGPGSYRLPSEFGYYESKTQKAGGNNNSQFGSTLHSFRRPDTTQTENVRKRPLSQSQNNFRVSTAANGTRQRKPNNINRKENQDLNQIQKNNSQVQVQDQPQDSEKLEQKQEKQVQEDNQPNNDQEPQNQENKNQEQNSEQKIENNQELQEQQQNSEIEKQKQE